jgi:hypothetical protein
MVNELRRKYRTYVVEFDVEHVSYLGCYVHMCPLIININVLSSHNELRRVFFLTFLFSINVQGAVLLPMMFSHDFGDQVDHLATLVDCKGNEFEVYVQRHISCIYLNQGMACASGF